MKKTTVSTKTTTRKKVKLKGTPEHMAKDCAKSIVVRGIRDIMVFGQDEYTDAFLVEAMKNGIEMVRFSDFNQHGATHMNRIIARFNGSAAHSEYVNGQIALKEAWGEVLVFGSSESANKYAEIASELPYKEIFVLEDF